MNDNVLFEAGRIGAFTLKNRFVRSATGESRADKDGRLKAEVYPIYEALAAGGAGLIVSGHMYVHPERKCSPAQTGIWDEMHLPGLTRLVEAARTNGARAVAQLNDPGRRPETLTEDDIAVTADRFVEAGARAVRAGFDGVQIHAAHGYLLSGFLTPSENLRRDRYGCDAAGRRRLVLEIAARLRETLGPSRMLLCKLGAVDGRDNSLPLDETVATAVALREVGTDAIEVSCTFGGDHAQPAAEHIDDESKEAYFASLSEAIRKQVRVPVILVGGLRSVRVMQRVVTDGICDFISLSRPLIREPDLVNRFAAGTAQRSACISCNQCFNPRGFRCVFR